VPESHSEALMRKALYGRSGLYLKMLPQGLKYLSQQMMAALYFGLRDNCFVTLSSFVV
jgi:hypothetical protein